MKTKFELVEAYTKEMLGVVERQHEDFFMSGARTAYEGILRFMESIKSI